MVQRLLEIDTYRMLALLALPLARAIAPFLTRSEQELAQVATPWSRPGNRTSRAPGTPDRLEAEVERREAQSISASAPRAPITSWSSAGWPSCARCGSRACRPCGN